MDSADWHHCQHSALDVVWNSFQHEEVLRCRSCGHRLFKHEAGICSHTACVSKATNNNKRYPLCAYHAKVVAGLGNLGSG